MKSKNFIGRDMREALRRVRAEFGVDAVILSTRATANGVEINAAVDAARLPAEPDVVMRGPVTVDFGELAAAFLAPERGPAVVAEAPALPAEQQAVSEELRTLRQLLERQLSALSWNDFTRREPARARALVELTELGVARDIALSVLEEFPANLTAEQAQRVHFGLLARRIQTIESPVNAGGAVALVGAAGSGRTSMLAKLATRWLLEHDASSLAIVTIDDDRMGAAEQVRWLGRSLGVPSYRFATAAEFADNANCIDPRDLLLIDTPPLSADLAAVQALADGLSQAYPSLTSMLLLPASTQAGALDELVRRAAPLAPRCGAITRFDEAVSLGGLLSTVVRAGLPIALVSDGPRIPDALRVARPHQLVARAAELARASSASADEDLLGRRFGGYIHAAA